MSSCGHGARACDELFAAPREAALPYPGVLPEGPTSAQSFGRLTAAVAAVAALTEWARPGSRFGAAAAAAAHIAGAAVPGEQVGGAAAGAARDTTAAAAPTGERGAVIDGR